MREARLALAEPGVGAVAQRALRERSAPLLVLLATNGLAQRSLFEHVAAGSAATRATLSAPGSRSPTRG